MESLKNDDFEQLELKIAKINECYDLLFPSKDGSESIMQQILDSKNELVKLKNEQQKYIDEIDTFYYKTFIDYEGNLSTNTQIKSLISDFTNKIDNLEQKQTLFESFYDQVFEGTNEEIAYKSQFKNCLNTFNNSLKQVDDELSELMQFYNKVVDTKDDEGKVVYGLESLVLKLKMQLQTLIESADSKLHAITDSSLHNAFAVRADSYTKEFQRLEKWTFGSIIGLIADLLIFGLVQVVLNCLDKGFNYHILIYQFSIAGSLILAIWMFNRNQKIAKKLAEEYHHKASISEAMTGYRTLYGLEHDNEEYMTLFNSIKDQLNVNPSKQIDEFLNLKSPNEELTSVVAELLNPKNLEKLATQLKPVLDKIK